MADGGLTISKGRLDALTDGVFAFAMTLLVLNLEIPEDIEITSGADLLRVFGERLDALLAYAISFFMLGRRWFGQARTKTEPEEAGPTQVKWVLVHLFFITMVPFSTQVVSRYDVAPAIWLYAANITLAALAAMRLAAIIRAETGVHDRNDGMVELGVLVASALVSVAISFVDTSLAMLAYLLTAFAPLVRRITG